MKALPETLKFAEEHNLYTDKIQHLAQWNAEQSDRPDVKLVAVLSTAHLTIRDAEQLHGGASPTNPGLIGKDEYSFWFHLSVISDVLFGDPNYYSIELWNVLKALREAGFRYVNFDQDGTVMEELPVFDW